MTENLTKVEDRSEIEEGDKITIIKDDNSANPGEKLVESVEVTDVSTGGLGGELNISAAKRPDAGTLDSLLVDALEMDHSMTTVYKD